MEPSKSSAPSGDFVAVTPHDTNPILAAINGRRQYTRGVYVGGAGNLVAINAAGTAVTFTAVPAGTLLPISVEVIRSTSTTATAIVALF